MPLLLIAAAALGGDGIDLKVTNDGTVDIFVNVLDISAKPGATLLNHQRINGFSSVPISATADANGKANLSWTAVSVDSSARQCGHGEKHSLDSGASVNVHVDSSCGS